MLPLNEFAASFPQPIAGNVIHLSISHSSKRPFPTKNHFGARNIPTISVPLRRLPEG